MTDPGTGAGGTAVGITAGSSVWVRTKVNRVLWDGFITVRAVGDVPPDRVITDTPALRAVAEWLAEHEADRERVIRLIDNWYFTMANTRDQELMKSLMDALATDGGA